ncbi:MAG TPA: NAD-binding protein [Vicinamibacterales bacterium]|nr:NAD-binding protein [Vicinamibacterales bacterium]
MVQNSRTRAPYTFASSAHVAAGQTLVAAPVLGRPDLAASGQLGVIVAAPEDAVQRCEPLLQVIGRRTFVAGTMPEAATAIKLADNLVLGCAMIAMAEGFSLVRKYGVETQVLYDVMTEGLFSSPAYKGYGRTMVEQTYDRVGSPITVGLKARISFRRLPTWRRCRCRVSTSIAIGCSAPWRTATATRIKRCWPANRHAPAGSNSHVPDALRRRCRRAGVVKPRDGLACKVDSGR